MTSGRYVLVALVVLPAMLGCIRPWGPEDVRRDLSRSAGVRLEREFGITVGRTGMWVARTALRFADEPEISLRGVHRVEVGVYRVEGLRRGLDEPRPIELPELPEWTPWIRVHDDGESAFVLVRERDERIRGLLVVAADDEEWVLVRLKGKLDRILEDAMRMAFDEADRPDLYEKTREERGLPLSPDPSG